jgi:hypothetical protein
MICRVQVRALYRNRTTAADELAFEKGDIIRVVPADDSSYEQVRSQGQCEDDSVERTVQ